MAHPRHTDRMYRLLEIARIARHDFALQQDDAYDVIAADHWTDKQPDWRLYADIIHLSGLESGKANLWRIIKSFSIEIRIALRPTPIGGIVVSSWLQKCLLFK